MVEHDFLNFPGFFERPYEFVAVFGSNRFHGSVLVGVVFRDFRLDSGGFFAIRFRCRAHFALSFLFEFFEVRFPSRGIFITHPLVGSPIGSGNDVRSSYGGVRAPNGGDFEPQRFRRNVRRNDLRSFRKRFFGNDTVVDFSGIRKNRRGGKDPSVAVRRRPSVVQIGESHFGSAAGREYRANVVFLCDLKTFRKREDETERPGSYGDFSRGFVAGNGLRNRSKGRGKRIAGKVFGNDFVRVFPIIVRVAHRNCRNQR